MKVNRLALIKALQVANSGVAKKLKIEQSDCFVFLDGRIVSFNDETATSVPFDAGFEGAVPAKELLALVNKVKSETIDFTVKDSELRLKSSKAKAGLRLDPEISLPLEEVGEPEAWIPLPGKFPEALKACMFSASRDQTKPILTCIHVTDEVVESCDNNRATRALTKAGKKKAFSTDPELATLIPAIYARDILSCTPTEVATTDGWLHFRNKQEVIFSCRYIEDEYPNLDDFFTEEGGAVEFPTTLSEILDRADVLGDDDLVNLFFSEGTLTIATENEVGWFEEVVDLKHDDSLDGVEFDIQPEFLKAILKTDAEATIGETVLSFQTKDYRHVVARMEPKGAK